MKFDFWAILGAITLPITIIGLIYIFHFVFTGVVDWQRNYIFQEPQQPYIHLGDDRPINRLYPGEPFFVHVETERKVICSVTITYHIIQQVQHGNVVEQTIFETLSNTHTLSYPGHNVTNLRLMIPTWLAPGEYFLDRTALYNCDHLMIQQSPQIPITIIPRSA
jgi:hypothetical protein